MSNSIYMNNFTFSIQNFTCILNAKSVAPDIERSNFGPVLDEKKTVDETYVFMPIEAAKELALSILQMVDAREKRSRLKINLEPEKQALWDCYIQAGEGFQREKQTENPPDGEQS